MQIKDRPAIWRTSVLWGWWKVLAVIFFLGGLYDLAEGQSGIDLPSIQQVISWWDWKIWFIIALVLLLIGTCEGAYRQVKKYKKQAEQSASVEQIARVQQLRILYENRMIIPDKLYALYKLGQTISREHKDEALPYDDPKIKEVSENLASGGFFEGTKLFLDMASSDTLQQMKKYAEKADPLKAYQSVNRILIFIKRGMAAENVGIDRYLKPVKEYQNLLNEISALAVPLPVTTANKITEVIEIIEGINTLNLIDFSNVDANPSIKIMMQAIDQAAEFILKPILHTIESDIEKFLAVQRETNS